MMAGRGQHLDLTRENGIRSDKTYDPYGKCGIKGLQRDFDFSNTQAYALYAPNGVMKSSLAQTFQDAADDKDSEDRIFTKRKTVRKITDEAGEDVSGRRILVVTPYDEQLGLTEQTSTLLLEPKLKKEFDDLLRATEAAPPL